MKSFTLQKGQRQYYFVIALSIILVIIVILIAIISFTEPQKTNNTTTQEIPPPSSIQQLTQISTPVKYNQEASLTLLHREEKRTPLSASDIQAKEQILQLLPSGQNYGTVYLSQNIIIEYVQSLDLFQVEVLTINVAAAKREAEDWFKQQGMSQQGICYLPLGFYPSWDTANILNESNYVFNKLPDGC